MTRFPTIFLLACAGALFACSSDGKGTQVDRGDLGEGPAGDSGAAPGDPGRDTLGLDSVLSRDAASDEGGNDDTTTGDSRTGDTGADAADSGLEPACIEDEDCAGAFDDLGACQVAICDSQGKCDRGEWGDGSPCDDGDACTSEETCTGGVCTPGCSPGQCGDDGCGGSCGGCPDGQTCTEGACVDDGSSDIACPWTGPLGKEVGKTVPDFTVTDCDGNEVSAHELCGARAALIFDFSGW